MSEPQRIDFQGQTHEFPAEFTQDQVSQALQQVSQQPIKFNVGTQAEPRVIPALDTSVAPTLGGVPMEMPQDHVDNVNSASYHGAEASFKLHPMYSLGLWDEGREQFRLADVYSGAPTVAALAAHSKENATRYARIADHAAAVERLASGNGDWGPPLPEEIAYYRANGLPVPQRTRQGLVSGALSRAFIRAGTEIYQAFADLTIAPVGKVPGIPVPGTQGGEAGEAILAARQESHQAIQKNLDYLKELSGGRIPSEETFYGGIVTRVAGFIPTAIELAVAPEAAFPVLALHGYGALRVAGADQGWAMAGGLAGGAAGAWLGQKFIFGLAPRETTQYVQQIVAAKTQAMFTGYAAREALSLYGPYAVSGYLSLLGMGLSNEGALILDQVGKTGKVPDASELWTRLSSVLKESLVALPFAAIGAGQEFFTQKGRFLAAHGDRVALGAISDVMDASSDPEAMRDVLRGVVDERRKMRQLQIATQVAEDTGAESVMALRGAEARSRGALRAYVTAPAFRRAAEKMGILPEELARKVLLNGSTGFKDAEIMKIPLEMSLDKFLIDMQNGRDAAMDGTSMHVDTPSVEEVRAEEPEARRVAGQAGGPHVKEPVVRAESSEVTSESPRVGQEHAQGPMPASERVRTALEEEAAGNVSKLSLEQIGSSMYKNAIKQALVDFKTGTPEERQAAANAWERARAHEVARVEANKEAKEIQKDVRQNATNKARDVAYAAGSVNGQAYEAVHGALGSRPDANADPVSLVQALGAMEARGDPLGFDQAKLVGAVAKVSNGQDLSLADLREVRVAMNQLAANAESAGQTMHEGEMRDRGAVIDGSMRDSIYQGKPPGGAAGPPGILGEALPEFLQGLRAKAKTEKMTHHTLLQPFGKWGEDHSYWYLKNRRAEDALLGSRVIPMFDLSKDMIKLGSEPVSWPRDIQMDTNTHPPLQRRDAWRALLNMGNVEDSTRISERWGMTEVQIESWLRDEVQLTQPEYEHVHGFWRGLDYLNDLADGARSNRGASPLVRKTPRTITTEFGTYRGGSAPFGWYEDTQQGPQSPHDLSVSMPETAIRQTFRAPKSEDLIAQLLKKKSPDIRYDTLRAKVQQIVHDVTFSDFNRDMYGMLSDQRFKDLTNGTLGEAWYKRLTQWFDVVKDGHISRDSTATTMTALLYGARHLTAQAAFNLNVPVVGGQIAHLPTMMARYAINPLEMRSGIAQALDPAMREYADTNSEVVPFRTERFKDKYLDLMAEVSGEKRRKIYDLGAAPGLALQHAMDEFLTRSLWHTFEIQALNDGLTSEGARRQADLRTDQSMPGISVMDQSALMRDRIYGAFFLVRNYPQAVWNLKAMDDWDTRSGINSERTSFVTGYGGLLARKLGMYGGLGLGMYLMGHGRTEAEQRMDRNPELFWRAGTAHWLAREVALEATYGNPIQHELLRTFSSVFDGGHFNAHSMKLFDTPVAQLISRVLQDLGKLRHLDFDDSETWPDAAYAAMDAAGRAFGVIAPAVTRSAYGAYQGYRLLREEDFTLANALRAGSWTYYGKRRETTPFTDPIDYGGLEP